MQNEIVFIVDYPFTQRDYDRFGIHILQQHGFSVQIWDLGPIIKKGKYHSFSEKPCNTVPIKYPINKRHAVKWIRLLYSTTWVFFSFSYTLPVHWVYRGISVAGCKTMVLTCNVLPESSFGKEKRLMYSRLKSITPQKLVRYFINKLNLCGLYLMLLMQPVAPITVAFGGGLYSMNSYLRSYPITRKTKRVYIHQLDYDIYLSQRDISISENNTAVFLDSYEPFHPDYTYLGLSNPLKPDEYYQILKQFFSFIELTYNLNVVIAAHPRSQYENGPDYFNGRRCVRGDTLNLIKRSKFVLLHSSTAINFAVLHYKPCVFLVTPKMSNGLRRSVYTFAKQLDKVPVELSKGAKKSYDIDLSINLSKYYQYKDNYIKHPDSKDELFWKQVGQALGKMYE